MPYFDDDFAKAIEAVVIPSESDIRIARGCIVDLMRTEGEPPTTAAMLSAWLVAQDIPAPTTAEYEALPSETPGRRFKDPDRMDPVVASLRAVHAVRWALARLIGEGEIMLAPANHNEPNPQNVSVRFQGSGDSVQVRVHSPDLTPEAGSYRYMLIGPKNDGPEALLPIEETLEGLADLLGERGMRLVRESWRARHRGLFVAAASLLAAASEAAWFNLGRSIAQPDTRLYKEVDDGEQVATVIRLSETRLRELKLKPVTVTEVVSHAHHFRDIRNYALHPRAETEADREGWLTEAGATLLAMGARRYFVKLADLQRAGTIPQRDEGP